MFLIACYLQLNENVFYFKYIINTIILLKSVLTYLNIFLYLNTFIF